MKSKILDKSVIIREGLIKAGIKNLNEFGYSQVDEKNILTDDVYSQFFLSMLNDNLGHNRHIDIEIKALIAQIKHP